ncbi:MAG TPA: CDP-archaeol synthase [Thermoleophilaceae bacterium]|jgi:CDP-2,3-bis-(O-geranylgeranyl)-sn-glycerol synthase
MEELSIFLPVLGALVLHAPVLRYDLLPGLRRPIDGGATFRGRRVLGDNKTWRGALVMLCGVVLAALLLWQWDRYRSWLPGEVREAGPLALGLLAGLGTVVGELPNSFAKRQLGIEPGRRRRSPLGVAIALYDQADFVPGILAALAPIWLAPLDVALAGLAIVAAVHLVVNVVGYAIGARSAPI